MPVPRLGIANTRLGGRRCRTVAHFGLTCCLGELHAVHVTQPAGEEERQSQLPRDHAVAPEGWAARALIGEYGPVLGRVLLDGFSRRVEVRTPRMVNTAACEAPRSYRGRLLDHTGEAPRSYRGFTPKINAYNTRAWRIYHPRRRRGCQGCEAMASHPHVFQPRAWRGGTTLASCGQLHDIVTRGYNRTKNVLASLFLPIYSTTPSMYNVITKNNTMSCKGC